MGRRKKHSAHRNFGEALNESTVNFRERLLVCFLWTKLLVAGSSSSHQQPPSLTPYLQRLSKLRITGTRSTPLVRTRQDRAKKEWNGDWEMGDGDRRRISPSEKTLGNGNIGTYVMPREIRGFCSGRNPALDVRHEVAHYDLERLGVCG